MQKKRLQNFQQGFLKRDLGRVNQKHQNFDNKLHQINISKSIVAYSKQKFSY